MSKIKYKVTVTLEKIFEADRKDYPADWTDEDIMDHQAQYAEEGYFVEWDDAQVIAKAEKIEDQTPAAE